MSFVIAAIFAGLVAFWLYKQTRKPEKFPPGPPRWPVIGSIPYISNKENSLLLGLRQPVAKFGPIMGFYIGSEPAVLVADFEVLKEICKLDSTSYRPNLSPMHFFRQGWQTMQDPADKNDGRPPGVIFSNGNYWRQQRRFLSKNLKDFGFGKSSLETLLDEEVLSLCRHMWKESGQGTLPVSLMLPLKGVIISILWTILFGEQRDLNDPDLVQLIKLIDEGLRVVPVQTFLGLILPDPGMTNWPILNKLSGVDILELIWTETNRFIGREITRHRNTFDENNIRGFVDRQLLEIQKTTDPKSSMFGETGFFAMFNNVADIFVAGQDTTSSTILWTLLYLLHHPEVQAKVHQELDEVVGRGRRPGLKDQDNLNYLNAVLLESHRCIGHVPLGVVRQAQEDVQAGQYRIPKGAMIMSGLYFIMNDPKYFENPELFNPDRFIDPDSGKFVSNERVIPFGLGKRNCLGQALGEQEVYIFVAGILSMFEIMPVAGFELPSYKIESSYPGGMVRSAPKFDFIAKPRVDAIN